MANVTVTLTVDTADIQKPNVDAYCSFGQSSGSNEDYTTVANVNDTITWQGASGSSASDVVNITAINYEGGNNIFNQPNLQGNGGNPETVQGTVQNDTGGDNETYTIFFTVYNGTNQRNGQFRIDPKIQINP
jgi:hypothetical protein